MVLGFIARLHCFLWLARSLLRLIRHLVDLFFHLGLDLHVFAQIQLLNMLILRDFL